MVSELNLVLSPQAASSSDMLMRSISRKSGIPQGDISGYRILRKSIDARRSNVKVNLSLLFWTAGEEPDPIIPEFVWNDVSKSREVLIVGSGPAGLFSALELIRLGLRPVILERGKDVSARKVDIALISREHKVNPESNYCFGEGGAGTFSDGKLYTRSKKRGDNRLVLELLKYHGADESILFESHPHIGTDKLPGIVSSLRKTITSAGGIFLFEKKVSGIIADQSGIKGLTLAGGEKFLSDRVVLATGHSARDIYHMLDRQGLELEPKTFAMGVRIEHPQELINNIQYHGKGWDRHLPSADYSLAAQCGGRGVYSFCMCPGGFIVPAATSPGEVVVNGMSSSNRNSPYANSGIVVEIRPEDIPAEFDRDSVLAGLNYQSWLEKEAYENADKTQRAPAQRLTDFLNGKASSSLPAISYFPGAVSSALDKWLPGAIAGRLGEAFRVFDRKMKGFITSDAVITGVESRSSSPVRIPRDHETLMHISMHGLYPAGEGSGYSGGILSSAIDGIRVAQSIARELKSS